MRTFNGFITESNLPVLQKFIYPVKKCGAYSLFYPLGYAFRMLPNKSFVLNNTILHFYTSYQTCPKVFERRKNKIK